MATAGQRLRHLHSQVGRAQCQRGSSQHAGVLQHSDDGLLVHAGLGRASRLLHLLTDHGAAGNCRAGRAMGSV